MIRRLLGVRVAALTGIVTISMSAIFVRLASQTPITAAFFRPAYALIPLVILSLVLDRDRRRKHPARQSWLAFGAGAALAFDLYFWHQAIEKIGAGLATVVANSQVVLVGLAAWLLHQERPHARTFAAVPVVFTGVVLISGLNAEGAYGADPVGGTLLGLCSAVAYAGFLLLFRAAGRGASHHVTPLAEATVATALVTLLIGQVDGKLDPVISLPAHGWLVILALGCTVFGWSLLSYSITRLPALETSVMLMLQPMLTMFWAAPLFGEWISGMQWAGVGLVLGGVGYLSIRGSVRQSPESATAAGGPSPRPSADLDPA